MVKSSKSFFEKVEAQVVEGAESYVKDKVKKKLIQFGEFSVLVFLSFIMISFGIAYLIGSYFPPLDNGLNFILMGMIFLVLSMLVRM